MINHVDHNTDEECCAIEVFRGPDGELLHSSDLVGGGHFGCCLTRLGGP